MRKFSVFAAMLLALCALGTAAAQTIGDRRPQVRTQSPPADGDNRPAPRPAPPQTPPEKARFVITGARLHANDETGVDRAGSDEIVVAFHDEVRDQAMTTSVFGDFDTGETRGFRVSQACIAPAAGVITRRADAWSCARAGAPGPVRVEVVVLEVDDWSPALCGAHGAATFFSKPFGGFGITGTPGAGCEPDLVGRQYILFSQADLLRRLRVVGASREYDLRVGGYTLTYRIERVANAP